MTREEWALIAAYIATAVGKEFSGQQMKVYFDLLGDLPAEAVAAGAKAVLARSPYPTLPTAGAIRSAIVSAQAEGLPTPMEAWGLAMKAVNRFGLSREREALESLPAPVAKAVEAIGWRSLCDARLDEQDTIRAHFLKGYEIMGQRDQSQALLPNSVREVLTQIGRRHDALPAPPDNRTGREILKTFLEGPKS